MKTPRTVLLVIACLLALAVPASAYNPYFNPPPGGGSGSMTWPSSGGIPVYSGSSSWGTSVSESDGYVVYGAAGAWGKSNAPAISAANMTGFPTLNQSTTGTAAHGTTWGAYLGISGPLQARTATAPDADFTILYDGKTTAALGVASTATGQLYLYRSANGYKTIIQGGVISGSADLTFTWPTAYPSGTYIMTMTNAGQMATLDPATFLTPSGSGAGLTGITALQVGAVPIFNSYTAAAGGIAAGDCVYVLSAGTVGKAKGNAIGTMYAIGFAPSAITAGNAGNIQIGGVIAIAGKTFTPGLPVFISAATGGDVTQTPPSAGNYAQRVGIAVDDGTHGAITTALQIQIGPVVLVTDGLIDLTSEVKNVLPSANGGAGTVSGIMKADGSGTTSAASVGTDYMTPGNIQSGTGIYYAATTADNAAYVITPSPAIAAYAAGHRWDLLPGADNTGAATLNVSGKGARNILKRDSTGTLVVLAAADLKNGQIAKVQDDGTQLELMNPTPSAGGASGTYWSFGVASPN